MLRKLRNGVSRQAVGSLLGVLMLSACSGDVSPPSSPLKKVESIANLQGPASCSEWSEPTSPLNPSSKTIYVGGVAAWAVRETGIFTHTSNGYGPFVSVTASWIGPDYTRHYELTGVDTGRVLVVFNYQNDLKDLCALLTVAADNPTNVYVSPNEFPMQPGESLQAYWWATGPYGRMDNRSGVIWSSSNPSVASVSSAGLVTAHANGPATITATYQGVSGSAPVSVVPTYTPPQPSITGPTDVEEGYNCTWYADVQATGTWLHYYWYQVVNGIDEPIIDNVNDNSLTHAPWFMMGDATLKVRVVDARGNEGTATKEISSHGWGCDW